MFPRHIQYLISNYNIFGFIPLDKTLHFVIGTLITIILRLFKIRMRFIFLFIIVIELIKEFIDYKTLNSTLSEQIIDALITLTYPIILILVIKLKENLNRKILIQEEEKKRRTNQK